MISLGSVWIYEGIGVINLYVKGVLGKRPLGKSTFEYLIIQLRSCLARRRNQKQLIDTNAICNQTELSRRAFDV